ncbi:MAG: hypothetical protein JW966_04605 [Anaerolineae bacterium]|nr:hypothetical protein [Anaerolineae bacterium]
MDEKRKNNGPGVREAERLPGRKKKTMGSNGHSNSGSIPGINVRELIEERNWTALAGLALIGIGVLYLLQDMLGLHLELWSMVMVILGGWLMWDGWQTYTGNERTWSERSRSRMIGGGVIALIGAFAVLDLSGWGLFLLVLAGWLAYDTWQKYQAAGRIWTERSRNRMVAVGVMTLVALFGLIDMWSAWPVLLIGIGTAMLLARSGRF